MIRSWYAIEGSLKVRDNAKSRAILKELHDSREDMEVVVENVLPEEGTMAILFSNGAFKSFSSAEHFTAKQIVTKRGSSTVLWDIATAKKIGDFNGPWDLSQVAQANQKLLKRNAFSTDFKHVFSWDATNGNRLWETGTGKVLCTFKVDSANEPKGGPMGVKEVSLDGKKAFTWSSDPANNKTSVGIWDTTSGTLIRTFIFQSLSNIQSEKAVAFSPDGTQLLACGFIRDGHVDRGAVGLWDVGTGKEIRVFGRPGFGHGLFPRR